MNKVHGFERINERRQRPNKLINFIKPLEGSDKEISQDFLERVAAICYPVMRVNNVVVMSLEEYPPNKEFWGRNFNAGEIIQLVLRAPGTGQWLPFKHVQMVMMHELAHCKQMNHSRDFWKVNNAYRDELKELWGRKYTGEGLWGRGQTLLSGRYMTDHMPDAAEAPSNLCGGTYRSRRGKKRKRAEGNAPNLSYAERKQRRIAKKFGVNGQPLGADEYARFGLDQGRHRPSKPRVAGSKRGRELRMAAALARFDKVTEDVPKQETANTSDDEYETDSDDEENPVLGDWDENDDLVRVCENEDQGNDDAQRELDELRQIDHPSASSDDISGTSGKQSQPQSRKQAATDPINLDDDQEATNKRSKSWSKDKSQSVTIDLDDDSPAPQACGSQLSTASEDNKRLIHVPTVPNSKRQNVLDIDTIESPPSPEINKTKTATQRKPLIEASDHTRPPTPSETSTCEVCSYANELGAATCGMCSHVMDTNKIKSSWSCRNEACHGSVYRNLGDYGRCYICSAKRPD